MRWILIANRGEARVVHGNKALNEFALVHELHNADGHHRTRDLVSDRPGRTQRGVGGATASLSPRTDPERTEASRFARELCGVLKAEQEAYDQLVLIASPAFLGELRAHLDPTVAEKVTASIARDLTRAPLHALSEPVRRVLGGHPEA